MADKSWTSETKKEYETDAQRYYRNVEDAKRPGPSADSAVIADSYLPSRQEEQKLVDYYTKGFDKTSRSGSFTDNPNASPAIFPNGLKFASNFIDKECTPGKYRPSEPMKPPTEQSKPVENIPKLAFIIADVCLECLKEVDPASCAWNPTVIMEQSPLKLHALGVRFGDLGMTFQCMDCHEGQQRLGSSELPLVLVHNGGLTDERDIELAKKYNVPVRIHDGDERTLGQWYMQKRAEKLDRNLHNYLCIENLKTESSVFRNRAKGFYDNQPLLHVVR